MYSVFRNHGTCANGAEAPLPLPTFAVIPVEVDGSDKRNASFGSSFGKLEGSGFNALFHVPVTPRWNLYLGQNIPESSAPSSHNDSQFPNSKGIPSSASTIIGKGVSFTSSFKNSGRVYRLGLVGISRSFGGNGGAGTGLEYRTRTRRSSFELLPKSVCMSYRI